MERLLNLIPKQKVSLSEAGSLVSSLRADIWGDQHLATLKEALASALEDSGEPVQKTRVQLQDNCALVHYLDQAWWLFLLGGRGRNDKSLALARIQLRRPLLQFWFWFMVWIRRKFGRNLRNNRFYKQTSRP